MTVTNTQRKLSDVKMALVVMFTARHFLFNLIIGRISWTVRLHQANMLASDKYSSLMGLLVS